ncbi:SusC/RagA family TonB-linked outer membrane protein [Flavobacterium tructae]|uniref:SusC/RagA family TonB-linked outer membrane protein n=1 Tax=Flavobacterium tructae TaxID=1114873 RepID=A0A1S1J438_9FLAO|nr:SusC/RagA family TonB-linked outer membrane protein [Flavobacterium tructae]OHT44508.1 SusC/RagA family TonB-linked outer membrane protein [Flavobacterium tructae]OXB19355.1 SusC/RagA family TonB-linked outer membrane protein [Flavobacterium tructae]OXB23118.1 SusC/RagA family TonB-linked outer membrane protein [Flavobacterium tructae]
MKFKFFQRKTVVLFFVLLAQFALAQERVVSGIVSDNAGLPLPGASVLIKGTKTGAQTDFDGKYSIKTSQNAVLIFNYIGMKAVEVTVTGNTANVSLSPASEQLQEIVVTALGLKREKKSLGYATQEIKGEDLTKVNNGNVANAISGKIAGVQIRRNNNIGGSTNVVIRGTTSLTGNNQALWIVDGIPLNNDNTNSADQKSGGNTGGYDYGNAASDINPDDIETMNVLKGAAASALYGSRASNGVILVTLKKGSKSKGGLGVSFSSGVTVGVVDKKTLPEYQNQYGGGYGDFYGTVDLGSGVHPYAATDDASWGPKFDPSLLVYNWSSFYPELPGYGKATPWTAVKKNPNDFYQKSLTFINNIAFTGSGEKGDFRFGYTNYNMNQGILPNSNNRKDNFNFSGSYNILPKTKISASANYLKANAKGMNETGYGDGGNNYLSSIRQWYSTSVDFQDLKDAYDLTGKNTTWSVGGPNDLTLQFHDNPYFQRYNNYNTLDRDRFFGNFALSTQITDWFDVTGKGAVDTYSQLQEERIAVGSKRTPNALGQYTRFDKTFREINFDLIMNFKTNITDGIKFNGMLGANSRRSVSKSIFAATNGGLVVPGIYALSNSIDKINSPGESEVAIGTNSVYANASFNFMETYFLEGSYRVDKSSTLPSSNSTYTYPSITGTYIFSNHIKTNWLSFGKLRLNYAETGNDAPFAVIAATYPKGDNFGPDGIRFSTENNKSNSNLKSELTRGVEAGIELKLFNNRVGLDFSYYKSNTTNQILSVETPTQTGYTRAWINGGDVQNKGYEVTLSVIPVKTANFSWEAKVNWSTNKNEVISLGGADRISLGSFQGVGYVAEVGKPIGQLIGSGFTYLNGEKVIRSNGRYLQTAGATIGDINPDWIGGLNNVITYKNFSLNFLIDVKKGGDVYSLDQRFGHTTGIYESTVSNNHLGNPQRNPIASGGGILLSGVKEDGTPNDKVVSVEGANGYSFYNSMPEQQYVYDASYVKLRELGLSYRLPSKFLAKTFITNMILSVNGSNLWIIHKNLPYADPEAGLSSGNLQGFQTGVLPTSKEYNFNMKVQF